MMHMTWTTYLKLGSTVSVESLLVDALGESQRIEKSSWGDHSNLVLVSHLHSRSAGCTLGRGERSSGAEESGEDSGFHGWRMT